MARTRCNRRTDRRTDRQTDRVIPIYPQTLFAGGIDIDRQIHLYTLCLNMELHHLVIRVVIRQ